MCEFQFVCSFLKYIKNIFIAFFEFHKVEYIFYLFNTLQCRQKILGLDF